MEPEESESQLDGLLKSLESDGEAAGEGSFSLDPRRALTMLRSQGRLSGAGPLFLASAIYQHTEGSKIRRTGNMMGERLYWPAKYGPLPETIERILAQEAFMSRQIKLEWLEDGVAMRTADRFRPGVSERVEELFSAVSNRLDYFPWAQPESKLQLALNLSERTLESGRILLREPTGGRPTICWLVAGVAYREAWPLPVDGLVYDDLLRPDISLTVIPESSRKNQWLEDAEALLLESLRDCLETEAPFHLSSKDSSPRSDPILLRYLPFVLRQNQDPEMAEKARAAVSFPDIYGGLWGLGELEESYLHFGRLLVVPSVPEEISERKPDRPILWWSGQAKRLGERVFPQVFSGAGYLYSLRQNEREKERVSSEETLASVPLEDGQLSLLSWSEEDRPAEVVMVGKRRAAETFYLDDQAPTGLRLLWDCEREVGELSPEAMFGSELRVKVLELLDQSLANEELLAQRLVSTLLWALNKGDPIAAEWTALKDCPLLPDVHGRLMSYCELRDLEAERSGLPVLEDLSTSLPDELPGEIIVWLHPLLDHLNFQCKEMGREVREAHWREEGRAKWLQRFSPQAPKLEGYDDVVALDGHLLARTGGNATVLTIWREGRPLGKRKLGPNHCEPGYTIIWKDDNFTADRYWSGPDTNALLELYPKLREFCKRAGARLS